MKPALFCRLTLAVCTAALLAGPTASAADAAKAFVVIGDFTADNGARDPAYAAHLADLLAKDILARGIGFGDSLTLRATATGGYASRPEPWMRSVTLSARGGTPAHVPDFLASRMSDFASVPLAETSDLIWTIEELGHELGCKDGVETHIYVVTNGVSATHRTATGLSADRISGGPLEHCASLSWVGIGAAGDFDLATRRGLDALFVKLGQAAGAETTHVLR